MFDMEKRHLGGLRVATEDCKVQFSILECCDMLVSGAPAWSTTLAYPNMVHMPANKSGSPIKIPTRVSTQVWDTIVAQHLRCSRGDEN